MIKRRSYRSWTSVPFVSFSLALACIAPSLAAIHAGDTLYIKVWNHPELSKQVVVDASGGVRVPLSGVVGVGGLDEADAGKKLADALRPMIAYPAVSVETIDQSKNLFVSGGPGGVLKYGAGETLAAAIADVMASVPSTTQTLDASGQNLSKTDGADTAVRARIDLHHVGIERDGKRLGSYDTVAFGTNGDPGPALEPGDTIVFTYKPVAVRIAGDVAHPGTAYLDGDQSLSEAIAQAGGLLPTAASTHIVLQRNGTTRLLAIGDATFAAPAQPGDVVTVPVAPRVAVLGTVQTPGVVALKTDSTLLSALYTAGGPTKRANLKDVQIVRGSAKTTYDVTALTHGDMSQNPALQDGDTVVVPETRGYDWSSLFGILGGVAAGLASRVP